MQQQPVPSTLALLLGEVERAIEARAQTAPRALRCALQMALTDLVAEAHEYGDDMEEMLQALVREIAFELGLHTNDVDADELANELSALIVARLSQAAVAA